MRKININGFLDYFNNPVELITIEDLSVVSDMPILITSFNFKCKGVIIRNCVFNNDVKFANLYSPEGLNFQNCVFEKKLFFENISLPEINDHPEKQIRDHLILNLCNINEFINIAQLTINGDVVIKSTETNKLYINQLTLNQGHFLIDTSIINQNLYFKNLRIARFFRLDNSTINCQARISDIQSESYDFIDSLFKKDCWIYGGLARNGVSFMRGHYEDDFVLDAIETTQIKENESIPKLIFNYALFQKSCYVNYYDNEKNKINGFPEIYIDSTTFTNSLVINNNSKALELYNLKKINIDASKQLKGELIFNKIAVEETILTGANYESSIIFNNYKTNKLLLKSFSNYGKLQFVNVGPIKEKHSALLIYNSFLGNALFSNMNFKDFIDVEIENSDLTNISTSCVTWFTEENIEAKDRRNTPKNSSLKKEVKENLHAYELKRIESRRELYRQLKLSLEKQGDKIQSLIFKKYEMKAHHKFLRMSKGNITDRFILWVSQTNNHGLNWLKPVLILIPFMIFFYILIIISYSPQLSFSRFNLSSFELTFNEMINNINLLPELFNPAHSIEKILPSTNQENKFLLSLFDFLSKLFLAFFIFQIVTAFRKFSK